MKLVREEQRRWQMRHARYSERARLKRRGHRFVALKSRTRKRLIAPATLDFMSEYATTITFIEQIRDHILRQGRRVFINMQSCSTLLPEVAVVLAAELQRCRDLSERHCLNGMDPMHPKPRQMLHDLGFHSLLGFRTAADVAVNQEAIRYIAMRSGSGGDPVLFQELEELVFGEHVSLDTALSNDLLAGLHEATLNVIHHAYLPGFKLNYPVSGTHRWWSAGYRNAADQEIVFIFYDQGVSIPATLTLKTSEFVKLGLTKVAALLGQSDGTTDGELIRGAVELGRTSTAQGGRGYGLNDLRRFVDTAGSGNLTILSRRGCYVYAQGKESTSILPTPFAGTLIVWRLKGSEKVKWS